jgi:hypothetical protein
MAPPVNTWIRKYGPGHKRMIHSIFHVQSLRGYFNISAQFLYIQKVRIAIDLSRNQERHKTSTGFWITIFLPFVLGTDLLTMNFLSWCAYTCIDIGVFCTIAWHEKNMRRYKIRLIFTDIYAEIYQINSLKNKIIISFNTFKNHK